MATLAEGMAPQAEEVEVTEKTKIVFLVKENPKRKGSQAYNRFGKYMKAKTVGEYLKLGGTRADLRYDENKGFIQIAE